MFRRSSASRGQIYGTVLLMVAAVLIAGLPVAFWAWTRSTARALGEEQPAVSTAPANSTGFGSTKRNAAGHSATGADRPVAHPSRDPSGALPSRESGDELDSVDDSLTSLESFSAATEAQLDSIAKLLMQTSQPTDSQLQPLISNQFRCTGLRPTNLQKVFRDNHISVSRGALVQPGSQAELSGAQGLSQALGELTKPYPSAAGMRVKFKTFRVETAGDLIATRAYFHATGTAASRVVEQTATWRLLWSPGSTGETPQLQGIEVEDFEEISTRGDRGPLFSDATLAVFDHSPAFHDQLMFGIEYWRSRFPAEIEVDFRGHHGMAIGDVNGDGLDDVYLCQPHGLPDRLFVQTEQGTARDISREAGVDWLDASKSALLVDLDNDGDQDLIVCMKDRVLVMSNDGNANFQRASSLAGPKRPHSITSADYDNDGRLDLYVCGFWRFDLYKVDPLRAAVSLPTPWHDANNGARNHLYRNEGGLVFSDVTQQSGLDENNTRFSHAAGWEDFDNDGDSDLYVANDFGRNNLYRNDGGQFVDIAAEAGVEDMAAGMSVAWSDYNKDGWMDLYVSNMFSAAGGRISYHRKFQEKLNDGVRSDFQRHARGNTLFANSQNNLFRDLSEPAAVVVGRWAWSSNFVDINNDGWDDIFVANGFVTNEDTRDL